ncbi:MAG: phosphoglucosamine mutase [Dongiaceae bacterium]
MEKRKLFGTDGVRGLANDGPMTAETMVKLAMAASHVLAKHRKNGRGHARALIGKDTRLSGYLLEPALTAGFISAGMDVLLLGPMPTPAIAMLTRSLRADLGVVISASHNAYEDNGVKFFAADGYKLSDAQEAEIESLMNQPLEQVRAPGRDLGRAQRIDDAAGRYIEFVKATLPKGQRLNGLKIVIDCANGAAYKVAPAVLWELGATVIPLAVDPDGLNINKNCGAVSPQTLQTQVVAHGADIGIALDGDADRVIICDEQGAIIDGDQILGLIATRLQAQGILTGGGIVATVMSNLGLEQYLTAQKLSLQRSNVGDRYVMEDMRSLGRNLGGEQSGHIILSDYATTGDGLIAALQVLSALIDAQKPASQVCRIFTPLPQLLKSVKTPSLQLLENSQVQAAIKDSEARLKGKGRLLVRKSGTEPVIRLMAEGEDEGMLQEVLQNIEEALKKAG